MRAVLSSSIEIMITIDDDHFIQTPATISERAGERKVRLRDTVAWPYFGASEIPFESHGDALNFRSNENPLDDSDLVCVPKRPCDVFEFETDGGDVLTWYARSNLVAWQGELYAVFYECNHLLGSYAWLTATDARVTRVRNSGLHCRFRRDGRLFISGLHVHRCTGEIVSWIRASGVSEPGWASASCMRMRPPEPWYAKGFLLERESVYLRKDYLNKGQIRRLQRWMRERHRRCNLLSTLRCAGGWFSILCDDVLEIIVSMVREKVAERDFAYLRDRV